MEEKETIPPIINEEFDENSLTNWDLVFGTWYFKFWIRSKLWIKKHAKTYKRLS